MALECVGILKVDRVRLVGVLGDIGQVETESFAETTKFNLALMLEAKLERLLCDVLRPRVKNDRLKKTKVYTPGRWPLTARCF
jgi:hypothetical protein